MKTCFASGLRLVFKFFLLITAITASAQSRITLVGSGSNLPSPVFAIWIDQFNKLDPGIQVRYLALGTEESLRQISAGTGDFGAGEVPLTEQLSRTYKNALVAIPSVPVGVVPIYNLPGQPELRFTGELMAEIFLGSVKNWNDARIARLNPHEKLPDLPIAVIHRTPGKGSNFILTDFLSKTSSEFRARVGKSASPKWPLGAAVNRGEDMVDKVQATSGAFGYVEEYFAVHAGVGRGAVQNASGEFVLASVSSISAACDNLKSIPKNFAASLANASAAHAYPITSFSWIYLPVSNPNPERRQALAKFLDWVLGTGQDVARDHGYAILPAEVAGKARESVAQLQ